MEADDKYGEWISRLIEVYKHNTIKESQLLIDRFRL
jgi:hypothetical protein